MKIVEHLDLAGKNLLGCLCPEANYLPYWHMVVEEDLAAEYEFRPHCTGHNVGRWWNAMLRLQACTGFDIPSDIEAAMLENTWRLSDNPTGILLEDPDPASEGTWYIHSYRETMLALGLLVSHRASDRARQQGVRAVTQMRRASQDLTQWDLSRCASGLENLNVLGHRGSPTYTHGRAIEGLLCFHGATDAPEALEEVARLADFHFAHTVRPDGELAEGGVPWLWHTHSYLNTIRGLVMWARQCGQVDRLETILATYRKAVAAMITPSGFVTHNIGDRLGGDIASAGDIAHIALLLWDWCRDPRLLDDAERIVRCRLLPAQVRETIAVRPARDEPGDCFRNLPERFVGAIGGSVGHVRGQTCVTDYTAAALHTLIELYQRTVDIEDARVRVNFHFDWHRSGVRVESVRDAGTARVTVRNETGKPLLIRVPGWAPESSIRLSADGRPQPVTPSEGYVAASGDAPVTTLELSYSLPEHSAEEEWRDEFATAESVTFHWRGDQIAGVDWVGGYLEPFAKECR